MSILFRLFFRFNHHNRQTTDTDQIIFFVRQVDVPNMRCAPQMYRRDFAVKPTRFDPSDVVGIDFNTNWYFVFIFTNHADRGKAAQLFG